jgi:hypothetical protein
MGELLHTNKDEQTNQEDSKNNRSHTPATTTRVWMSRHPGGSTTCIFFSALLHLAAAGVLTDLPILWCSLTLRSCVRRVLGIGSADISMVMHYFLMQRS